MVLPMFKGSDSLAVKYLVDEIANRMQLSDPQNKQRGYIDPDMVAAIHAEPFNRSMQKFLEQAEQGGDASSNNLDTQALKIHAQKMCLEFAAAQQAGHQPAPA